MENHHVASTYKEIEPHYVTYMDTKPIFECVLFFWVLTCCFKRGIFIKYICLKEINELCVQILVFVFGSIVNIGWTCMIY